MEQSNNNATGSEATQRLSNPIQYLAAKEIKTLYVGLIVLLEDSLEREEISENLFGFLRKRILDSGNNAIRNLDEQIKLFTEIQKVKSQSKKEI